MSVATPGPLDLKDEKITIPGLRSGTVARDAIVARLNRSTGANVVCLAAPSGYGKTTVLAQWAATDGRPFAWLRVDESDNDTILLLRYVLASLGRAGLVDASRADVQPAVVAYWSAFLPRVCRAVSAIETPFVFVLDDVHKLESTDVVDALGMLIRSLPNRSQLALSGHSELVTLVAATRARGALLDLGSSDLALTREESVALLAAVGVELTDDTAQTLTGHAEGWAAGLYLTALALKSSHDVSLGVGGDSGGSVSDYLWAKHLSSLPGTELAFLTGSSVLERMSAPLCDAVLERRDSGRILDRLEHSNLFLVPLDRERRWFRYHDLFRSALRDELDRTEPTAAADLRRRAADWCEANGLREEAMAYAVASGDTDRIARLLVGLGPPLFRSGRIATVLRWLELFDDRETIDGYPAVAVIAAILHAQAGNAFQAERWLDAAERAPADVPAPDGSTSIRAWVATASALICRHGVERMRQDAELAVAELAPLSPLRGPAVWMLAVALLLGGDPDADARLEEAADAAEATGAVFAGVCSHAQRAILALDRGDVDAARSLLSKARALLAAGQFQDYLATALLLVADARLEIRAGEEARARRRLAEAQRLRPQMTRAVPYYSVKTLAEMSRAYVELGDANAARAVLLDATEVLRERPDLGTLGAEVAQLRERAAVGAQAAGWESSLTAAELRLLPLLTTHLTFREIGQRLGISRNTVKTQAISIYRKLAVTSRSAAVQRAEELGLVESSHRA